MRLWYAKAKLCRYRRRRAVRGGADLINISWPSQQPPQLNRILARGELRVSAVASPLISFNKQGQASGFDYELAQRFADSPRGKTGGAGTRRCQ